MAPEWERIDVSSLGGSRLRDVLAFLSPDGLQAYRSDAGAVALVFPLGAWLASGRPGLRWVSAGAAPSVDRDEWAALLSDAGTGGDTDALREAAQRDGASVAWVGRPPVGPAPAEPAAGRGGALTLGAGEHALTVTLDRLAGSARQIHELPESIRKGKEGPTNLRDRERWFRSRTGSGQ